MSLNKSKSLRTAEKYVLQGKLPAAIDEYRKIVDADPADLTTINTLGDLYVRAGRIQEAIKNFSRIAESYREGGFTLKAIAMLKKISKLDPTNVDTAMKLANLYSQQGLLVEARQQYLQVADAFARNGQAHRALEAYQKIADLDPSNTSVRMKLGEIYVREGMKEQAHEAFVTAGAELLRKNDLEQALTANLKAIAINPDSRQALTALATIYTQQGQPDKAINILCDAFEHSPGDTEILTILGRTYLAADWLDDAERTFLSLVELDRSRYHYLLDVGRRFLHLENLDRAAELVDGCIDILIAKREEDKALDFLRRILDHDPNHVGALKRLAQIFLRIREDHNLLTTLNSIVDAATKKGMNEEAIAALKELVRLEPDEAYHRQRLQNLGVTDWSDVGSSGSAYTFSSFGQAADEAYIIRQISEAEILAGLGQIDQAVENLQSVLSQAPESLQIHLKLKDIFLRNGRMKEAAARCLELSRIHEGRGETARSSDYLAEAKHLYPDLHELQNVKAASGFASSANASAFGISYANNGGALDAGLQDGNSGFSFSETSDHFGFEPVAKSSGDNGFGFEMFADSANRYGAQGANAADHWGAGNEQASVSEQALGFFNTNSSDTGTHGKPYAADLVFKSTGNLPTDIPQMLRDELEGIDFYIAQGYADIASDTLERLRENFGDHPEILARYAILGIVPPSSAAHNGQAEAGSSGAFPVTASGEIHLDLNEAFQVSSDSDSMGFGLRQEEVSPSEEASSVSDLRFETIKSPATGERQHFKPILIHKDSGTLNEEPDLMVKFNTADLVSQSQFEETATADPFPHLPDEASVSPELEATHNVNEAEALSHLLSSFDFSNASVSQGVANVLPQDENSFAFLGDSSPLSLDSAPLSLDAKSSALDSAPLSLDSASLKLPDWASEESAPEESEPVSAESLESVENIESNAAEAATLLTPAEEAMSMLAEEEIADVEEAQTAEVTTADESETEAESATQSESFSLSDLLEGEDEEEGGLQQMLEDFIEDTDSITDLQDYETHYSLGLAYKDMELLDEAIEQFQMAYKLASRSDSQQNYIECCHMLGFCFRRKYLPKVAVMWFQRGLQAPNSSDDELQALRYEIGSSYEEMGDTDNALDSFLGVYATDVNYRDVSKRIRDLQAIKMLNAV